MYTCKCDNCHVDITIGTEYSCLCIAGIHSEIENSDWHETDDGKHYCELCWSWGDNDELVINKARQLAIL